MRTIDATRIDLIRSLHSLRATDGAIAGGKGANLGELVAAGFPVPDGFVVTTAAYWAAADLANVQAGDPAGSAERLRAVDLPADLTDPVLAAYRQLGGGAVAVRSSATAEDLPGASFAGQQDTFLNVRGDADVLDAVRRCWASLWNERAVSYRASQRIDDASVGIAVVVQQMVDASAAGVLFTADPITGRRHRAVIDAASGLGDVLVSGGVDPDHFVADARAGRVLDRAIRGEQAVLDDETIIELARFGARIEDHFGAPQDIEFAVTQDREIRIVQSRPITTLYPLPANLPDPDVDLRVFFSGNVFQGYFEPVTPIGMEPFVSLAGTITRAVAGPSSRAAAEAVGSDPPATGDRGFIREAAMRVYLDVTPILRDPIGREAIERATALGEARSSVVLRQLATDPRLARSSRSRPRSAFRILRLAVRSGVPVAVLRTLRAPERMRRRMLSEIEAGSQLVVPPGATSADRVDLFERWLLVAPPRMAPRVFPLALAGVISYAAVGRLLGDRARPDELQTLTRGLAHNPTTEMDLALWALATEVRSDSASRAALETRLPSDLAESYLSGDLPPRLQGGLAAFLDQYGFRGVGEIDLGVPRWRENPTHILGALANYVRLDDPALAPDTQFARGRQEAEAMAAAFLARVSGPRRRLLRFFLSRVRSLMGLREQPKFELMRTVFSPLRELLRPVGVDLAAADRISTADDVWFLRLAEIRRALAGEDLRSTVADRRATYERERARRHIPRVLLSDGTDAEIALIPAEEGTIRGTPASPGIATGVARVIRDPHGARLEPGEILVAPSTDPGWTPLFLTAGGLVMEMGGMISHGAVVAREYGIPAVVGVPGAADRIVTGQRLRVDGSTGVVSFEKESGS
jgi:pyruvate,water dikinase